jgi:hypothetical protein
LFKEVRINMGVTTGYHRQALWFLILGLFITLVSSSSSLDDTKKSDSGITSYVGRILPNEDAPTNNVERHSHSKGISKICIRKSHPKNI